jgi:hypothetical protein
MHLRDAAAYSRLAAADPVLAQLIERVGRPDPFTWTERDDLSSTNFEIKALHIAGEQISTAAAMTIYCRVPVAAGGAEGIIDQEGMVGVGDAASLAPLTTVRHVALWSAQTYAAALPWAFPVVPPRSAQGTAVSPRSAQRSAVSPRSAQGTGAMGSGEREEAR